MGVSDSFDLCSVKFGIRRYLLTRLVKDVSFNIFWVKIQSFQFHLT